MCSHCIVAVAESPLVSIAIVAHNNWPLLEATVESALAQTWARKEIIVVDNDSRDETSIEVPARYAGRVKYVRQANVLDGGGYNRGIADSSGEFIQLLDGDDLLAPDKIEMQMNFFLEHAEADIVYGDAREFIEAPDDGLGSRWEVKQVDDMLMTLIEPEGKGAGLVIHSTLFRRAALEKTGAWDETLFGADMDYWLRAAASGCRFMYSPGAWCYHRRRAGQMSGDTGAMVNRTVTTLEKALGYIDREPYRSALKRRLAALQYSRALTDMSLTAREARTLLDRARETDSARVSAMPYAMGRAMLAVPGARAVVKSDAFSAVRKRMSSMLGVTDA